METNPANPPATVAQAKTRSCFRAMLEGALRAAMARFRTHAQVNSTRPTVKMGYQGPACRLFK